AEEAQSDGSAVPALLGRLVHARVFGRAVGGGVLHAELPETVAEVLHLEPKARAGASKQLRREHEVEVVGLIVGAEAGPALDGADFPNAVAGAGHGGGAQGAAGAGADL